MLGALGVFILWIDGLVLTRITISYFALNAVAVAGIFITTNLSSYGFQVHSSNVPEL
jgi:hypothetical protein